MILIRVLFYSGLVFSLVTLLIFLILPTTGLEALGAVLAGYFAWLYHLITLPVVIFIVWRSKFKLFYALVIAYYLLISLSGLVVVLVSTGTDAAIREKIEASTDSVGHEIRTVSKTIQLRAMQGKPSDPNLHSRIVSLLAESPDINRRGESTQAAFWYLAAAGEEKLVKMLIDHGAHVEDLALYESSPLYIAADNGHSETARILIEAGAILDSEYRNYTPLMASIRKDDVETVKVLIQAGADVNKIAHEGTAFSVALARANTLIIEALLKAGSDTKLPHQHKPAIFVAYENKKYDIVHTLIKFGQGWNAQDKELKPALLYLYDNCDLQGFQSAFQNGAEPNLYVEKSHEQLMAYLLKNQYKNCDVLPFIETLVQMGASVNNVNQHQQSFLILALRHKLPDVATLLSKHGARCDAYDDLQDSVLTLAIRNHLPDLAKYCLKEGSDINYRSPLNNSSYALLEAVKSKQLDLVHFTFENGAVLPSSETDINNLFRLTEAKEFVELLLKHYADEKDSDKVLIRGIKSGIRNSKLPDKDSILSKLP